MAAAIYIHAKKNRGYLQRLKVDSKRVKQLSLQGLMKYDGNRQSAMIFDINDTEQMITDTSIKTMMDELDPSILWKQSVGGAGVSYNYLEKIRSKVKFYESFLSLFAFISVLISIIEYERIYYPNFYTGRYNIENYQDLDKDVLQEMLNKSYTGMKYRLALSIISLMMIFCSLLSNMYLYELNFENKKTNESKLLLNFIKLMTLLLLLICCLFSFLLEK